MNHPSKQKKRKSNNNHHKMKARQTPGTARRARLASPAPEKISMKSVVAGADGRPACLTKITHMIKRGGRCQRSMVATSTMVGSKA